MTPEAPDLRSKLGRVKGLGPAHHGVSHWWMQRVTAIALVPLSIWFMYALVTVMLSPDFCHVAQWFESPVNAITTVFLLVAMFVHAKLGVQVVIEDYVHTPLAKYTLLLANIFVCYGFAIVCILAVLKLHLLDTCAGVV